MFKVGDFARIGNTSVKTLHHYDEIGLLRPAHVDGATGYRYYAPSQLTRLVRILTLRELGFALEQIAPLLDAGLSPEQVAALLRAKRDELAERVRAEQERLDKVARRLRQIEGGGAAGTNRYEVQLRPVAAQEAAALRITVPASADPAATGAMIGEGFSRLYTALSERRARPAGPPMATWLEAEAPEDKGDLLLTVPVAPGAALPGESDARGVFGHTVPAVGTAACVVHHGPLTALEGAYIALFEWIEENGYRICGPRRDVVLHYAGDPSAESLNESQVPVTKEAAP